MEQQPKHETPKKLTLTLNHETVKKLADRPAPVEDAAMPSNTLRCTCCGTTR